MNYKKTIASEEWIRASTHLGGIGIWKEPVSIILFLSVLWHLSNITARKVQIQHK